MSLLRLTGCCLVLLAPLLGCETKSTSFETVAEAREAGLYAHGWAPDVLPAEAGPIEEAHDIDTNARCLTAAVSPDSLAAVRAALAHVGFAPGDAPTDHWPRAFCPFSSEELAGAQLLYRAHGDGALEYAALSELGAFYYWSGGDVSR